jgi:uncharacterized protein YcsI (UPF0317 family)
MYRTNRQCRPAGRLHGEMVVSMRPIPAHRVADAVSISARFPSVHGAPVHVGDPQRWALPTCSARLWRPGAHRARRGAGVLGLRRHAPGGRDGIGRAFCGDPCAGHMFITDVPDSTYHV